MEVASVRYRAHDYQAAANLLSHVVHHHPSSHLSLAAEYVSCHVKQKQCKMQCNVHYTTRARTSSSRPSTCNVM